MVKLENLVIELPGFSLRNINLSIEKGECFILLGPTGSGKTLLLEAIAGILNVSSGVIRIHGKDVTGKPPEKRGIGIVYQDFALFPHLNVVQNVRYGLRYCSRENRPADKRIYELMELTGIAHLEKRSVTNLSGGEKQRVALVRALSVNPSVLLLDEPLSSLDRNSRDDIQKLLKSLHRKTGTTFLMVTHDFTEALFLGQRAAVLRNGRIEQTGPVLELFRKPETPFAARFLGIPNVFEAEFRNRSAVFEGNELRLSKNPAAKAAHIAVRPEDISIHRSLESAGMDNLLKGSIREVSDKGPYGEVAVQAGRSLLKAVVTRRELISLYEQSDDEVFLHIPPNVIHTF